jgi:hypothetical protein
LGKKARTGRPALASVHPKWDCLESAVDQGNKVVFLRHNTIVGDHQKVRFFGQAPVFIFL